MIIKNLVKLKELPISTEYCYSLSLDGVNEYINVPLNAAFNINLTNKEITLEGWVRFSTINIFNAIFSRFFSPTGMLFYVSDTNEIKFHLTRNGGSNGIIVQSLGANIQLEQWYHLMVTYDSTSLANGVKFYKNGVLLVNDTPIADNLTQTVINNVNVEIGSVSTSGRYANGLFNYVRWWNKKLTQSDVTFQYNQKASSAVIESASLLLNCGSGTSATWNGSGFDIEDPTTITTGYQTINVEETDLIIDCPSQPLIVCKSLIFDGVNEYISTPSSVGIFDRLDPFTFSMPIKPQFKSFPMIFSKYQSGTGYRCFVNTSFGNFLQFEMDGSVGKLSVRTTTPISFSNQWQLITITHDGSGTAPGIEIYKDGISLATTIVNNNLSSSILIAKELQIGGETVQPLYYMGNFGSFKIWDIELTSTDIAIEYVTNTAQSGNLVNNIGINYATFDGSDWQIPDLTGSTSIYTSVNMEVEDEVEDC